MSSKNRRITDKKNTKLTKGQSLARVEGNNQVRRELALAGVDISNTKGVKSYAEIAIVQGVYEDIADFIESFVQVNPFYTQLELMNAVRAEFPTVFSAYKSKYAGNFYKILEKDPVWRESLQASNVIVQRAVMAQLYQRAVKGTEIHKDKDGKYYEVGMKDKDAMDFIRLTVELENRAKADLEKRSEQNNNKISSESADTLNEIMSGLTELGGDTK